MQTIDTFTSALVRIVRLVNRGYVFHVSGVVDFGKVEVVVGKLAEVYHTDDSPTDERRRQRHREARARLVLWPEKAGAGFVLLATEGQGVIHEYEALPDVRRPQQRLRDRQYELLLLPRRRDQPRWSWRTVHDRHEQLLQQAIRVARYEHPRSAEQFIASQILPRPGLHGIRAQTRLILSAMKVARRRAGFPPLSMPQQIAWVRGTFRKCEPLDQWLATERPKRMLKHVHNSGEAL